MTTPGASTTAGGARDLRDVPILWLGEPAATDVRRVGGKAANLARLASRWTVPAGFCLPVELHHRIRQLDPRRCARALRQLVAPAHRQLAGRRRRLPVAVRSSATDEDTATASFAGQHETVLNAVGPRDVVRAIQACLASASTGRARCYRTARGLEDETSMAVLVQELVHADVSAVAFSIDPITDARDRILVNASYGLGQAVVDGLVTPDSWTVDRDGLGVADRHVADKDVAIVPARRGTRRVEVAADRRRQPALDDQQVKRIASMAVGLEDEMGWPVDIECAYRRGELFLLQCRPVTCLPPA